MPDIHPDVLHRTLRLRQVPLFASAQLDELATLAGNLSSASYPAGAVIATAGTRLQALRLVVSGRLACLSRRQGWGPRDVFGALQVAANRPIEADVVAATATETLELSASDFGEVLEDNFGVLLSALRDLSGQMMHRVPRPPSPTVRTAFDGRLDLVERLILLRQQLPFTGAGLHALAALAHASEEVIWSADQVVWRAGDPAQHGLAIVEGRLALYDGDDRIGVLGAGDHAGYLDTLAEARYATTLRTLERTRALRSSGSAILDMLEDHTDVGLAMIATFASVLLDREAIASCRAVIDAPPGDAARPLRDRGPHDDEAP